MNIRKLAKRQMRLAASGPMVPYIRLRVVNSDVWATRWPRGLAAPALSQTAKTITRSCWSRMATSKSGFRKLMNAEGAGE